MIAFIKEHAHWLRLVDVPNDRSSHSQITPRGAGIGIFFAVASSVMIFDQPLVEEYPWTFSSILLIFLVGVLDDYFNMPPKTKSVVAVVSSIMLTYDGIIIDHIGVCFGLDISLGWLAMLFTIFAVVAFTNALNFIDGLDGLAGGVSSVILASYLYIGYSNNDLLMIILSGSFMTALIGFLIFNWNPASIFMGDSGSLVLGFVISLLGIKAIAYIPAVTILFIAAIPIIDTTVVVVRRLKSGRSILEADRCHIHHHLKGFFGGNVRKSVILLISAQAFFTLLGLYFTGVSDGAFPLVLFLIITYTVIRVVSKIYRINQKTVQSNG